MRTSARLQEVQNISNHLVQLRVAASRLAESREALVQFDAYRQRQKEGEAPEVLVPLTGALYAKVSTTSLINLFLYSLYADEGGENGHFCLGMKFVTQRLLCC